jgi:hypothetical protein
MTSYAWRTPSGDELDVFHGKRNGWIMRAARKYFPESDILLSVRSDHGAKRTRGGAG